MVKDSSQSPLVTVYYDGICKMCSKEINYYKKIAPPKCLRWVDIARNGNALENYNVSQQEALLYLHVKDASGKLHIGVDAFRVIWSHLPNWRWLSILLNFSPIHFLAQKLYILFAKNRFQRSNHCKVEFQDNQ